MGTPKKKLPKVIKSLPQLGLFARVVVEKLSVEEIEKWTRRAPDFVSEPTEIVPEPTPELSEKESKPRSDSEYVQSNYSESSSGNESSVKNFKKSKGVRKRGRVSYIDSSEQSSSDTSSLDSSEAESYRRKRSKRRRKSRSKKKKKEKSDDESNRRVLPVRSAKRGIPIIYSDSEEEDLSANLIPVNFRSNRATTSKAASLPVDSVEVHSEKDCIDPSLPSTSTAVLNNVSADIVPTIKPSVSSAPPKTSVLDSSSKTEKKNKRISIKLNLQPDIAISKSVSDITVKKVTPVSSSKPVNQPGSLCEITGEDIVSSCMLPTSCGGASSNSSRNSSELLTIKNDDSWKVVSDEENVDVLDRFKVVNKNEANVGKIRLRSLQSLGASDSFIKEAKLQHHFREGKVIQSLYTNHVHQVSTKNLLEQIAENLKLKIIVTEEFNLVLKESGIENKSKPPEIVNDRMEVIVQKRLGCDKVITKLFTNVVELFYSKLEKQNEVEYFSTLLYLGFLYIINHFIRITNNQYQRSSLFKNLILVFVESLRNGNFKYEQIETFFLSNNFHTHCYKLIEHIETIQSQNCNLRLMKVSETSNPSERGQKPVPVRTISCKMRDSKLVIEYTKSLEDLETNNVENPKEKTKPPDTRKPIRPVSTVQPNLEPTSVIVSSNQNKPPVNQNKKCRIVRLPSNSVTISPLSNNAPGRPVNTSNIPQNSSDISLHSLLTSNDRASNIRARSFASQNLQASVIHPTQQTEPPHLPSLIPTSTNSNISNSRTNYFNSPTGISTTIPGTGLSKQGNVRTPVQVVRPIRTPKQPAAGRSSLDGMGKTKNRQVITRIGTPAHRASLPPVPQGSQNIPLCDPPPYPQTMENMYSSTLDPSQLRHALTGDVVQRSNMLANQQTINIPNQQLNNSVRNSYNTSSIVTMQSPPISTSNCQPTYESIIPNSSQYIAQNQTNNSFPFPLNNMDLPLSVQANNQLTNMSQYQISQNQNLNSSFTTNTTDSSVIYRNNQLDSQSMYYNNNIASNQLGLNDMGPSAVNQVPNSLYYNYAPPVSLNQMHNQLPMNPAYVQSVPNQMQSQSVPLNQTHVGSVAANQFAQSPPVSQPSPQQVNQYFSTPSTTVHWVTQDSSYTDPGVVDPFPSQAQYQKYQQS